MQIWLIPKVQGKEENSVVLNGILLSTVGRCGRGPAEKQSMVLPQRVESRTTYKFQ